MFDCTPKVIGYDDLNEPIISSELGIKIGINTYVEGHSDYFRKEREQVYGVYWTMDDVLDNPDDYLRGLK